MLKTSVALPSKCPNQKVTEHLENYIMSIDEVEVLLDIDLFPHLHDSVAITAESGTNANIWIPELVKWQCDSNQTRITS